MEYLKPRFSVFESAPDDNYNRTFRSLDAILAILQKHDFIGIASCTPDEYSPEANCLCELLPPGRTEPLTAEEVHAVFVKMFSPAVAGDANKYAAAAAEIWNARYGK